MLSIRRGRGEVGQTAEVPVEAVAQRAPVGFVGTGFGEHHEVPGREVTTEPKGFAREPFESVPVHGALRGSTGDR